MSVFGEIVAQPGFGIEFGSLLLKSARVCLRNSLSVNSWFSLNSWTKSSFSSGNSLRLTAVTVAVKSMVFPASPLEENLQDRRRETPCTSPCFDSGEALVEFGLNTLATKLDLNVIGAQVLRLGLSIANEVLPNQICGDKVPRLRGTILDGNELRRSLAQMFDNLIHILVGDPGQALDSLELFVVSKFEFRNYFDAGFELERLPLCPWSRR